MTRRVIIDTDLSMGGPGTEIDDGFALALAIVEPELIVELVTTVHGNTDVFTVTKLTRQLLDTVGRQSIAVVQGCGAPLSRVVEEGPHRVDQPVSAPRRIAELVMANPGELTIIAIGPLTNIAAALLIEPKMAAAVREIIVMGGQFTRPAAEFNVSLDPEAAAAVLRSGTPQRWVGLDVTLQVRLTSDDAAHLLESGSAFGRMAGAATEAWMERIAVTPEGIAHPNSCAMHDPLAVAVATHPGFVTWAPAHVEVATGNDKSRGVTAADLLDTLEDPKTNCQIALAVKSEEFRDYFLSSVTTL